jgi:TM2 domain-containing membrane protein YozV
MEERIVIQQKPPKSPALAAILSIIFPGTGALYNGQISRGILYIVIFAGLVTMQGHGTGQPFLGLMLAGFYVFQIIDAVNQARAINDRAAGAKPESAPSAAENEMPAPSGSVFWGALLVVLGGVLLLANFDVIRYDTIFDFWPVAVIGIGLKLVIEAVARGKKA